jgi:hypothetical protein
VAPAFPPRRERARLVRACALLSLLLSLAAVLTAATPAPAKKNAPGKHVKAEPRRNVKPEHQAVSHAPRGRTSGAANGHAPRSSLSRTASRSSTSLSAKTSAGGKSKARNGRKGRAARPPTSAVTTTPAPAVQPAPAATTTAPAAHTPRTHAPRRRTARKHASRPPGAVRGAASVGEASATPVGDAPAGRAPAPAARREANPPVERPGRDEPAGDDSGSLVTRTVGDVVEVVPDRLKALVGGLAGLSLLLGLGYLSFALRARRLDRQRRELLQEVGLLQTALLPPVPRLMGALKTSVAYRPADGPGAGGDFYDALTLPGGRAAFLLGDISGHGRDALARTAFLRYTLRAYLEAGLEPRVALQVAGRVLDESLGGDFVTVILAVHDPASGSLTYACAGHPAPMLSGPVRFQPVFAAGSPPIGVGLPTGLRQTTIPLVAGSVACLYTDGMTEARTERGILGRGRLGDLLEELGRDAEAPAMLDLIVAEAKSVPDDMACCLVAPAAGMTTGGFRTEELELSPKDVAAGLHVAFLQECAVSDGELERVGRELHPLMGRFGGALLQVTFGTRGPSVEVLPRNVVSIEAASRRVAAAS